MSGDGAGQLLFEFVRHWTRRARAGDGAVAAQGRLVMVTEAVAAVARRDAPSTVNAVAAELGIDQSGASRLIRTAVDAGYVTVDGAALDARRRHVTLTPAGRAVLDQAREWQERVFDELTVGWTARRRDEFRRALADLLDRSVERA